MAARDLELVKVQRWRLRVAGTVQGVGFRPFVHRQAQALGLRGFVLNDSSGVLIEAEGSPSQLAELRRRLTDDPPPLARVESVTTETGLQASGHHDGFTIMQSDDQGSSAVPVSVDVATCAACLDEMGDSTDRRYRYPFTNCTDCGPRYTIVRSVPYDRPATTMAGFRMCEA
ncbi:MAG TPA: acylphosphatase, partial [Acidimicrobiales bacterium]|nr:acylphosphatase [Acidimicrobiales bacterium]